MLEQKNVNQLIAPTTDQAKQPLTWQRVVSGALFIALGVVTAGTGIASVGYRLTHLVVDNALINGRIVRLQSPTGGNIKAFYAQPGVSVKSGQVLARLEIKRTPQEEQLRLQLERSQADEIRTLLENSQLQGQIQTNTTQLVAAKQSLGFLKDQLQSLDRQYQAVQAVDVQISSQSLSQHQAAVEAAIAKATAARSNYLRYKELLAAGVVSKQHTENLQFSWEAAEAKVRQAKAALDSAQLELNSSKNGVALAHHHSLEGTISDQRTKLLQAIQVQQVTVSSLEAQVVSGKQQLKQAQSLYKNRLSTAAASKTASQEIALRDRQSSEISAPFAGVVYSTEREQGEQVAESAPVLTLLNCNEVWVETIVPAHQASKIDAQKPVRVQLAGFSQTLSGEVDLMQPISSIQGVEERTKLMQVQALMPTIPPELVGQPLVRVTVRIPPPPQHSQSQQFCGLGQATQVTFSKKSWGI